MAEYFELPDAPQSWAMIVIKYHRSLPNYENNLTNVIPIEASLPRECRRMQRIMSLTTGRELNGMDTPLNK